jgi:hypothetical protein
MERGRIYEASKKQQAPGHCGDHSRCPCGGNGSSSGTVCPSVEKYTRRKKACQIFGAEFS